jgi:hypothetical protein
MTRSVLDHMDAHRPRAAGAPAGKKAAVLVGAMGGGDKQEHWLTEGFGPADLREAKALLEEVF